MDFISWLFSLLGFSASPEALIKKGAGQAAKGNVSSAVGHYKKAISVDPYSSRAYDGLGRVYFKMDLREQAEREFMIADGLETLRKNPEDLEAALKIGPALMSKGRNDQARACMQPLLQKHSNNADLLKALGLCSKALNDNKKAREYLNAAMELKDNDPDLYLKLGELEFASGNQESGKWFTEMSRNLNQAANDPADTASRFGIAHLFLQKNQFQNALPFLQKSVEIDPGFQQGWLTMTEVYKHLDQPQSSIRALEQVIKLSPEDSEIRAQLADLYDQIGDTSRARSHRETAEVLKTAKEGPGNAAQAAKYVNYLVEQGESEKARDQLAEARTKWPDNINLRFLDGRLSFKEERYAETIALMKDVAKRDEKRVEPHIFLSLAYNRLGQYMAALAEGQLAVKLAPKNAYAHQILGDIYGEQKKFSLAAASFETAERLRGNKAG
ncbi:MAG: tetratricopeptide repeat protein [Deltaproteobacteria bacterium]|nr:tetratricopeptide repeat protein [Deltaproteobacteria bacterium]